MSKKLVDLNGPFLHTGNRRKPRLSSKIKTQLLLKYPFMRC